MIETVGRCYRQPASHLSVVLTATSLAHHRLDRRVGEADPARLNAVAADQVKNGALGLSGLGLAQHVEDVVGPDRFPVACTDVHAHQDIAFLDGGLGRRAARRDVLDIKPAAQLRRDGRDIIVRDRLGLQSQQPPDQVIGAAGRARPPT